MTTTINASTSAGLIQSADTSGILQLQTANLPAVTINAAQNTTVNNSLTVNSSLTVTGSTTLNSSIIRSDTAQASTSGTSINFTGIPSWVKRITVMLNGVSTSGNNNLILRIGGGSVEATGYAGTQVRLSNASNNYASLSTSFILNASVGASDITYGTIVLTLLSGNTWICNSSTNSGVNAACFCQGSKTTSTTLDRVSLTTEGSTDTFDACSINILYE